MEALTTILFFAILILLIVLPIFVIYRINKSNIKYKFVIYVIISTFSTALIMILLAWWADKSNEILLIHYGYDLEGMNEAEFYRKVLPKNRERVNELVRSYGGIGWPLKAILMYPFYFLYILIVFLINFLKNKYNAKK